MRHALTLLRYFLFLIILGMGTKAFSQASPYTARAYWEEVAKPSYKLLKQKMEGGDSLTENEKSYINDYEAYLSNYYQKLPQEEKDLYIRSKPLWDNENLPQSPIVQPTTQTTTGPYQWRARDRLANGLYGFYYGLTIVRITNTKDAATIGIPLITSGLWMIGPAINQKKYENITTEVVRASNGGKFLGIGYGLGLGFMLAGSSSDATPFILGVSTGSSILLGEIAFQATKKKRFSASQVAMMRHYGFLGPLVGIASVAGAGSENANVYGGAAVVGGFAGLAIGNSVGKKYDYSQGDVDAISSLTWISTAVGFTAITGSLKNNGDQSGLYFIPAATSIAGTILGQRSVRGVHLTDQQGATINLATGGAALIGLGVVAIAKSDSPAVWIGVPTALSLIAHQIVFSGYKQKNLLSGLRGSSNRKKRVELSLKVTPESYFFNQALPIKGFTPQQFAAIQNPLVKFVLKF